MLTALALAGAALLAGLVAVALWPGRARPPRRESLSRTFNFDRYKRYENK